MQETQETWFGSLGQEDPLEKGMATHSNILAWRISRTEEPGGLQSMGSHRVGQDWATNSGVLTCVFQILLPSLLQLYGWDILGICLPPFGVIMYSVLWSWKTGSYTFFWISWVTLYAIELAKFAHKMSLIEAGELKLCQQPLVKKGARGGMKWEVGGRLQRERTYVYLWLIHVNVWQKPTQHCISIFLQLKISKKTQKGVRSEDTGYPAVLWLLPPNRWRGLRATWTR